MPSFVYRAADSTGQIVEGVFEGESEADAVRALEQRNLTPLKMRRRKSGRDAARDAGGPTEIRLKRRELLDFSRQLNVMLSSGATLLATLSLLRHRAKGKYALLLEQVAADIQRGRTLSEALAAHPRTFDPFYIGTIRAGEAVGEFAGALRELIGFYERRAALRREVIGALAYPAIVVLVLIGALVVLLTVVVPQFESVFAGAGAELPLPTRILMGISNVVVNHYIAILGFVVALVIALVVAFRAAPARRAAALIAGRLPFFGKIIYLSSVLQFCRMIALLERAGLPMLETLSVVEGSLIQGRVRDLAATARRKIIGGSSISDAVSGGGALPEMCEHMIAVGESSGKIDETLAAAAAHFEEEIRVRVKAMTVALEPLLTLVVSAMVLGVALAIFMPMWEMNSLMLKH